MRPLRGSAAELKALCVFALEQPKNSRIRGGIVKLGERLYDNAAVSAILIDSAQRATPAGQVDFISPSSISIVVPANMPASKKPFINLKGHFWLRISKHFVLIILCKKQARKSISIPR